ncbi:calcium-binding protein [Rhizobium alvei]|uniref:Calcium-binding protein n=1 Tax=Rhizobium alvei TaxID=1132659 RepID=A0ABT8YHM6_9HYPH|nr:calcium-binding protein [Rhizobium alvei]MDO6963197.1 calcium-binding protein [Rhizobium alvei]
MTYIVSETTVVNTVTTGMQSDPAITVLADGGWIVTWEDQMSSYDIHLKVFNADGSVRVDETTVNDYSTGEQRNPLVVALADGGWVVVWESVGQNTSGVTSIYEQVFQSDGTAIAPSELLASVSSSSDASNVSLAALDPAGGLQSGWVLSYQMGNDTYYHTGHIDYDQSNIATIVTDGGLLHAATTGLQQDAQVAPLANGGFIAAWFTYTGYNPADVLFTIYDENLDPVAGLEEISVAVDIIPDDYYQGLPQIAVLEGGGWVIGWLGMVNNAHGDFYHKLRFYGADGTAGDTVTLNLGETEGTSSEGLGLTALNGGGFVATWVTASSTNTHEIYQQVFDAQGDKIGTVGHVNTTTTDTQNAPEVTALSNGGYVTVWRSYTQGNPVVPGYDIYLQVFDAEGNKVDGEVLVYSDETDLAKPLPEITALQKGSFVVTFEATGPDGSLAGIVQKTFAVLNEAPAGTDKALTVTEDTVYTFTADDFGFSDTDGDSFAGIVITSLPLKGTLTLNGVTVAANQSIDLANIADLVWTPPTNRSGNALAEIGFKVRDDGGTLSGGVDLDPTANKITFNVSAVTDVILGDGDANALNGTLEDDILKGLAGDDKLNGKAGMDRMEGGADDDTYTVDNSGDTTIEKKNEGTDKVLASITFALANHVENLTLSGTSAIDGTGNGLGNIVFGNKAANRLTGLGGNDTLSGGDGNDDLAGGSGVDTLTGGNGTDLFEFSLANDSGKGVKADHITDFKQVEDDIDLSGFAGTFTYLGTTAFRGKANQIHVAFSDGDSHVQIDFNGDNILDFEIVLDNVAKLAKSDFLL